VQTTESNGWVTYVGRTVACIPAVLVWTVACGFILKWFRAMARGSLEFGSPGSAAVLPIIWCLVLAGGIGALVLSVLTIRSTVRKRWQAVSFILGFLALLANVGD